MKFLVDFFPILLFFIAYKVYDIYVATAVAIAAAFIQVGAHWIKHKQFEKSHLVTLAILAVFGGATIVLQDEMFIKWKPSVVNWIFAIAFLGSQFIGNKTIVERMMSKSIVLPSAIWWKLNMSWVVFFFAVGVANLFVVYNFDTDTWVNFKLFGMMGLTIIFVFAQAIYMSRHMDASKVESK